MTSLHRQDHALVSDIGGTNIRAALVTRDGRILARSVNPTEPDRGIEDAATRLARQLMNALESVRVPVAEVTGVAVATAGPIELPEGIYNHPPNLLPWHGRTMRPLLRQMTGLPVWIGHDAAMAALGETRFGEFKAAKHLVYVTISTGVGGGIISNGRVVTGHTGGAGEVGHITVRPGGLRCNVGCDGCFEGNTCGPAIARMAVSRLTTARGASSLLEMAGGDTRKITSRMVFEAAERGDSVAKSVVEYVIDSVGIGLGSILNSLEPEALVLGGGVADSLKEHLAEVREAVIRHSLPRYRDRGVPVSFTTLGDDAGLLGAATLAFMNADEAHAS